MSASVITIRRLVPTDATACKALRLQGLQEYPTAFGSSYEEESVQPVAITEGFLAPGSGRNMFGAFDGEQLIGMAGIGRENGIKLMHKAFLRGVYVAPAYRGCGIAQRLIAHALQFAATLSGVRQVTLTVNANNANAIKLYEGLGFIPYGCEPDALMVDGQMYDEILMVRKVAPQDRDGSKA